VFTNGCFDVIHRGHIELLRHCSTFGKVYVGLNSDASVRRLKGNLRPINSEVDRKQILLALKWVEQVDIFSEDTPYELIKTLKPDLIVKGGDYERQDVVGSDLCEVEIFQTVPGYSSSSIIGRISELNMHAIKE